jgi:hypothetical protein
LDYLYKKAACDFDEDDGMYMPVHVVNHLEAVYENILTMEDKVVNGIIISSYSLLENTLYDLCVAYQELLGETIHFTEVKGKGIEQAANYLVKIVNITNLKNGVLWEKINYWNKIRNTLTHKNGFITDNKEKLAAEKLNLIILENYSILYQKSLPQVKLTTNNCRDFLDLIDEFLATCLIEIKA